MIGNLKAKKEFLMQDAISYIENFYIYKYKNVYRFI
jgi:hypothetical protein